MGEILDHILTGADSNTYVVFVHGLPGTLNIGQFRDASTHLADSNIAQSYRYSLRRDDGLWNELKAKKGLVGSVRQLKAFDCVDYQTHVNDLVSIVDGLRGRVIVAGHSYGAAVAIGASDVVSNKIEGMFLSSPFLELAWWKKLLGFKGFNGFPKADELVEMVQNYEGEVRVMYSRDDSINNPQKNAKRIIACKGEGSIARVNNSSQHDFFGSVREEYVALLGEFVSYVGREN